MDSWTPSGDVSPIVTDIRVIDIKSNGIRAALLEFDDLGVIIEVNLIFVGDWWLSVTLI